jgi:hypothetical protein
VVIGIDNDAEKVEGAATHARDHTLQRKVGDWDDAEQDALTAVEHEEKAGPRSETEQAAAQPTSC